VLVGSLNIVMPVVVAIARRDTCYKHSCCGRVEDKTVNQRRRGPEAEEAEKRRSEGERERKSEGESSDRIQNELEPAIEIKTVETVETVSADGIGGRDGATMANGVTMATRNHFSFFMALAFGIVFGGGLFALRRKVSLNLMVVVVETKSDKAFMRNQNGSFFFLSPDCLLIPFVPLFFTHSWH